MASGGQSGSRHRALRSRDSMKREETEEEHEEDRVNEDITTAYHYLNHSRAGAKRKSDHITVQNTPKKRRRVLSGGKESPELQDVYCWECHKECVEGSLDCASCVRCFHPACLPSSSECSKTPSDTWVCPVCTKITAAECAETRTWAMQLLSSDQLSTLLSFTLQRMKHSDVKLSEPFQRPVPASLVPDYYDIVFNPMDLSTLEKKVRRHFFTSSDAFLEEAKWIIHNSYIFNGPSSKYTNDAKLIIKICKHEISELELCPDCYRNSSVRQENWFAEPCTNPHCLVWAKLKGFPFWPAKALRMSSSNTNVDVRFFGAHDRAWIPVSQCFLLSEDCPVPTKNTKKHGLDKAMEELHDHVGMLREKFGEFRYAPFKSEFKPEHLYNCPTLFGGSDGDSPIQGGTSIMRPRPTARSPSVSSLAAGSDLSGSQDLEREDSVGLTKPAESKNGGNYGKRDEKRLKLDKNGNGDAGITEREADSSRNSGTNALGADSMSNGVFTLNERIEGADKMAESPAAVGHNKDKEEEDEDNLSCLERFKNSLQADLTASASQSQSQTTAESSTGESDMGSEGEEANAGTARVLGGFPLRVAKSTTPVASIRKRNLNLLLEKMHGNRQSPGVAAGGATVAEKQQSISATNVPASTNQGLACGEPNLEKMDTSGGSSSSSAVGSYQTKLGEEKKGMADDVKFGRTVIGGNMDTRDVNDVFQKHTSRIGSLLNSAFAEMWQDIRNSKGPESHGAASTSALAEEKSEMKLIREEINKMKFVHNSLVMESKHSGKVALSEIKMNMETERMKLVEDMKRKLEEEKNKAVADTKSKQWCASCGKEAVFYCCWNTSYCDYPCQQAHWPKHQNTCAQIRQSSAAAATNNNNNSAASTSQSVSQTNHHVAAQSSENSVGVGGANHSGGMGVPGGHQGTHMAAVGNHKINPSGMQGLNNSVSSSPADPSFFRQQIPGGVVGVPVGMMPQQGYILKQAPGTGITLVSHRGQPQGNGQVGRKF